jgi:hypothetical protein
MLFAMAGVMTFGFWKVGKGIREQKYALVHHSLRKPLKVDEHGTFH